MRPVLAPWSSRFHGSGMEDGPDAVLGALGGPEAERVSFRLDAPVDDALRDGLPALAAAVAASEDDVPLALLGECTLAPGAVAGLQRRHADVAVVWLDAHGDLNTPETSSSGFIGGMPFAVLVGWSHGHLAGAAGLDPVPEDRCILVGARDLDPAEEAALDRSAIRRAGSVAEALAGLPDDAAIYLHVDGDVVDPDDAPNVDFPAPGGWPADRLRDEVATALADARVVGVGVCCGNPRRDVDGRGTAGLARAVRPLLGG
ncbi:MAG: Arginase [uncultured Thermoleophilia bacterium]|uniref:Arginase n=1 Tax=uncultured Thermoleophilia bacterium TaxID=1497501 RepID=A0A6J4U4H9_9ACTN|nr:MAG: Arginase [uncultured Thermoleophilia bacterium]